MERPDADLIMRYAHLVSKGAAVTEREVRLDGNVEKVYFSRLSRADFTRYLTAVMSQDADTRAGAKSFLIARALCEPDGALPLTDESAAMFEDFALDALEEAYLLWHKEERARWGNAKPPVEKTTPNESSNAP